jgi:uridine kinase
LLTRTRALIETSDRVPVIGISGHGGSGKSTLSERIAADLELTADQVVPTDCFYATSCGPDAGMWEQHDWSMLEALVKDVRHIPAPDRLRYEYRWWSGETGVEEQPMPPVLIIEGIRLFQERTRDWFDLAVWIDMNPLAAGARAKARNVLQGDDQSELDFWDTKWIPEGHQYEAEVDPARLADLVLPAE